MTYISQINFLNFYLFLLPKFWRELKVGEFPATLCLSLLIFSLTVCFSLSVLSDSVTPWTAARQAPLSMGLSRQEHWSGLPCPPLGDLPNQGSNPGSLSLTSASQIWSLFDFTQRSSSTPLSSLCDVDFSVRTSPPLSRVMVFALSFHFFEGKCCLLVCSCRVHCAHPLHLNLSDSLF